MRGTEKQINWANEILARMDGFLEQLLASIPAECTEEQRNMAHANVEEMRRRAHGAEYAGDVIDLFKDAKTPEDVLTVWKITVPNTQGQHKILGR